MGEDVEVVVAGLPERTFVTPSGDRDFEGLKSFREGFVRRLANEEMHVLRHDDVAQEFELVVVADAFEGVQEDISCGTGIQVWSAMMTAKGDEVVIALLLISF